MEVLILPWSAEQHDILGPANHNEICPTVPEGVDFILGCWYSNVKRFGQDGSKRVGGRRSNRLVRRVGMAYPADGRKAYLQALES